MDVAIFELLMFVLVSPAYTLEGDKICPKNVTTESGELETKKICCKDFEEKNDKCEAIHCTCEMLSECSPGFRGWNCTDRCPENYYGRKCLTKCSCNETQICHPVCGCLQRLDWDDSNITKNGTSIFLEDVTSSLFAEECPTTKDMLSASTVPTTNSQSANGMHPLESNSRLVFLIGAASVTGVCIVFGIGLLYRLHLGRKKAGCESRIILSPFLPLDTVFKSKYNVKHTEPQSNKNIKVLNKYFQMSTECRVHHNMVYDLEDTSRIRENPSVHEEPAEPLYGECSYEDTCYSTLVLRMNNESGREPNTARQPVFRDDGNIYEFAHRYTHHCNEGQPPNVYITDFTEATE